MKNQIGIIVIKAEKERIIKITNVNTGKEKVKVKAVVRVEVGVEVEKKKRRKKIEEVEAGEMIEIIQKI